MSEQKLCGPWRGPIRSPSSGPGDFHFPEVLFQSGSHNGAEPPLTLRVQLACARNSCLLLEAREMLWLFATEHNLA